MTELRSGTFTSFDNKTNSNSYSRSWGPAATSAEDHFSFLVSWSLLVGNISFIYVCGSVCVK